MPYELKLPDLGEGLTEGEIARWLVTEGQEVAEDDPLVEIQTDKTTVEIPSPAAGVVARILAEEGEVVPVGQVIVVIGGDGATPAAGAEEQPRAEPAPRQGAAPVPSNSLSQGEKVRATPLVRRLAQELGVDLAGLTGSGPQGRDHRGRHSRRGGLRRKWHRATKSRRRGAASRCEACGG